MGTLIFTLLFVCLLTRQTMQLERQNCMQCDKQFFCDCSDESLPQIPKVPVNTIGLNLSFNHIEIITDDDLHDYNNLKTLYLQYNWVKKIHESAFSSLGNLERLDLSYNRLAKLSPDWFDWLYSLQHLNLLGNTYLTLGTGFLFDRLRQMRSLWIGSPVLYIISKNDLVGLSDLDEMVLSFNHLFRYAEGSLSRIRINGSLTLCLRHSFQNDLGLVTMILREICNPETVLTIADVMLNSNGTIQPFVVAIEKGVRRIFLKNVTVTDEAIIFFLRAMDNAPLTFLGIEDSVFLGRGFWPKVNTTRHDKLETLYIKNLEIHDFYAFLSLSYLANVLQFPTNISVINSEVFLMPCQTSKLLKRLEYLDFTGNLLTDLAIRDTMCGGHGTLIQLKSLNVSKNSLKSLALMSQLVINLNKLESLDLSQNIFSVMPAECTWPPSLRYLNLSLTQLRKITSCLPKNLHVLDLRGNFLTVFDVELQYLRELYISGNKFTSLPSGRWFLRLELLQIQQNMISLFDSTDLKEYKNLQILEAGNNKFVCSCDFLAFMQQKVAQLVRIGDGPDNYVCDSPVALRGQLVANSHLSIFECQMIAAVSGLCTIVFLATLICGILCYKLHVVWYIKMTWAWLQAKRKRKLDVNNDICYDAFISYSERDSEWVEEFLVQELEGAQPPFRLCLHKRDFLPGQWIVDNIINAMEKSRTTLFVLSQHFVSSEWCKYELDFSHFRLFDENNDTAVLILLEPIAKETIPKRFCKLRKFMNSKTYLEWPEDEMQRDLFWHNLKVAIKSDDF